MGIEKEDLRSILNALKDTGSREGLVVLGDAKIHCDPETYFKLAQVLGFQLAFEPTHLDAGTLGASLGFHRTETLDVNGKASLNVNLHEELQSDLIEKFDCLIDAGVLFSCFDPASVLRNITKMVKPGGLIIHITAVSGHYGRGYYNIHPLVLEDFYLSNNCEFVQSSFRTKFRPQGFIGSLLSIFRVRNKTSVNLRSGNVYLFESRINSISFRDAYKHPVESNMVPNNVIGVFIFRKLCSGVITMPVRMTPYKKDERQAKGE